MGCRPGEVGRLQNLRRPARVFCGVAAVGLLVGSFFVSDSQRPMLMTAVGAVVLIVVLLLPVLTEFQIDVFGLSAKASIATREQHLEAICRKECRQVASFASLVGVESGQIDALVEEAMEDACRLWRGPVVDDLVGRLLVCRTAHLIQVSLRLGGPYRILTPEGADRYGPTWAAFAALDPRERMIVALVEWVELDSSSVAEMLDLDSRAVQQVVSGGVTSGWENAPA